jgi:predicted DNA-binding protein
MGYSLAWVRANGEVAALLLARNSGIAYFMKKSITEIPKKRGRPATGKDPMFALRLPPELTARIDAFAKAAGENSRSKAMRRLLEAGLAVLAKNKVSRDHGEGKIRNS